jgi:hypothetical protein
MTEEETQATLDSLQQGASALQAALTGVGEAMAQRVPGPGRWSILQCVEHIALTEDFLFASIVSANAATTPLVNTDREARIATRGADRSRHVEAPEGVRPRGSFHSTDQALRHFLDCREMTLEYVDAHSTEDLRCLVTSHPLFGAMNVYEVLLLMAVHVQRHVSQTQEIKGELS